MRLIALALAYPLLAGSAAMPKINDERTLAFGCNDLVIIGRVINGDWHHVDEPDDMLGRGWNDAKLKVRRVVRGNLNGRTVSVRYFAHTQMREDRDFMLILSRQPDGSLVIETGRLMSAHPKLAARCD